MGAPFRLNNDSGLFHLIHADVMDGLESIAGEKHQLIISSPPYNIRKTYERDAKRSLSDYIAWQSIVAERLIDLMAEDGSLCWQVGSFVKDQELIPLDFVFHEIFTKLGLRLRNRIIWRFNFGLNADKRFSGRYETLLWYTRSKSYKFNLDAIRVPQMYPGKRNSSKKGETKAGLPSGNPLGKNPSDYWEFSAQRDFIENPVWDIPNLKANHVEKTCHPCQFPIELAERCVLAFTDEADRVLDPFVGTGSSVIAALKCKRIGIGIDKEADYLDLAHDRVMAFQRGDLRMRPSGKPVRRPRTTERVARVPSEWLNIAPTTEDNSDA